MSRGRSSPSTREGREGREGRRRRLHHVIADAGVASRRAAEDLIRQGRVTVDGEVVRALGTKVDPERSRVAVDDRPLRRRVPRRTLVVYKPRGVVTTTRDPHARRTVLDLVPRGSRLFPVGRLDAPSEGLLLLTNDGALAQALLHPSFEVPRTYRASVDDMVRADALRRLARGVSLEGRRSAPCDVRLVRREEGRSVLEIVLREGQNRQIRRMLQAVGHPVRRLVRTRFGPIALGGLRAGEWRALLPSEERALEALRSRRQQTGSPPSKRTKRKS